MGLGPGCGLCSRRLVVEADSCLPAFSPESGRGAQVWAWEVRAAGSAVSGTGPTLVVSVGVP